MIKIIGLFMLLGGLAAFFDNIMKEDDVIRVRKKIFQWWELLKNIKNKDFIKGLNIYFVDLFDQIYGKRHFSVKTFVRSCIFSIMGLVIAFIVLTVFGLAYSGIEFEDVSFVEMSPFFAIMLSINLIIDYFSLIETRVILRITSRVGFLYLIPLLFADLILTSLCYYVLAVSSLYGMMTGNLVNIFDLTLLEIAMYAFLCNVEILQPLSPFLYSTFFTSILFYLFVLVSFIIRLLLVIKLPILPVLHWFSSTKNPIKVLVGICAAIVLVIEGIKRLVS